MIASVSSLCGVVLTGPFVAHEFGADYKCEGCGRPQSECTAEYLAANGGRFKGAEWCIGDATGQPREAVAGNVLTVD